MIEILLFSGAGFLIATLIVLLALPIVTGRAAHKAAIKIQQKMPYTAEEVAARTDQLRADYAVSLRKLEIELEKHQEQSSRQGLELGDLKKKLDASNKLSKASKLAREEIKTKEFDLNERLRKRDAQFAGLEQRSRQILRENRDLRLAIKRIEHSQKSNTHKSENTSPALSDASLATSSDNRTLPKTHLPPSLSSSTQQYNPILENHETHMLEEKLMSFTAQLTSLAAKMEGEDSEIKKILANDGSKNETSLAARIKGLLEKKEEQTKKTEIKNETRLPAVSIPDLTYKTKPTLKITPVKKKPLSKEKNIIKRAIGEAATKKQ